MLTPSARLDWKEGQRSLVEHDDPNGRKPDGPCDGNDDPDENSQPSTQCGATPMGNSSGRLTANQMATRTGTPMTTTSTLVRDHVGSA